MGYSDIAMVTSLSQTPGWVYFVRFQEGGPHSRDEMKIGWSRNPIVRVQEYFPKKPTPWRRVTFCGLLPGTQELEREIHRRFADLQKGGPRGEYFRVEDKLLDWLDMQPLQHEAPVIPRENRLRMPRSVMVEHASPMRLDSTVFRWVQDQSANTGMSASVVVNAALYDYVTNTLGQAHPHVEPEAQQFYQDIIDRLGGD